MAMPRRLPPLNALRAFEAAGRHQSFTGAAEELNVSHAAISRHVRGLEARLGVQLFAAASRGVALTETGAAYLAEVSPALDAIAAATEALAAAAKGTLSVSAEPTFAIRWLAGRLGRFHARHPGIEVELEASPLVANLARHDCDMAIRFTAKSYPGLAADTISRAPLYPVGTPALREKFDAGRGPAALLDLTLLHEDKGALWRRWFAEAGLGEVALPPTPGRFSSLIAVEAALAGQGVALTSREIVAEELADGRLVKFSEIGLDFGGYYLVYLPERLRERPAAAFREWLLEESRELRDG